MACNIDHNLVDVKIKLKSQNGYLPQDLYNQLNVFLEKSHSQEILNEVFHLLKKYDLSETEEKERRNKALETLIYN
jgi:hypothetical protein